MVVEISDAIPLITIVSAALAPTIAAIWAGKTATRTAVMAAEKVQEVKTTLSLDGAATNAKLDVIHVLVNSRLQEALDELAMTKIEFKNARLEIEELKNMLNKAVSRLDNRNGSK